MRDMFILFYEGMQTSGEEGDFLWFPFQYKICQIDNSAISGTILLGQISVKNLHAYQNSHLH
jgi:hypothetical protein